MVSIKFEQNQNIVYLSLDYVSSHSFHSIKYAFNKMINILMEINKNSNQIDFLQILTRKRHFNNLNYYCHHGHVCLPEDSININLGSDKEIAKKSLQHLYSLK